MVVSRSTNKVFLVIFSILSAFFLWKKHEFQEAFSFFSKKVLFKETSINSEKKATYYDFSWIFRKSNNMLYVLLILNKLDNSYYVLPNFLILRNI